MKRLCFLILLLLASCGQSPEQLFETAEFEMMQTNYPYANALYQEILEKHPNSKFAERARKRLRELQARQGENGNANGKEGSNRLSNLVRLVEPHRLKACPLHF